MRIPTGTSRYRQTSIRWAFSLLEVMIAIAIFFTSVFVILELTSQHLRTARILQTLDVDRTSLPSLLSITNYWKWARCPLTLKFSTKMLTRV